jgi:hypothetical protein
MATTRTTTTAASTTFIDLATYSELESFLYGGPTAVTLFVSSVQKANWFSFIPVSLRHVSGTPDFGAQNVAASVNRSGDYVLNAWFRAIIPRIGLRASSAGLPWRPTAGVAWCRNLMHNLIQKCQITFNELVVQEFDNYYLDVVRQYKIPAAKQAGYDNMIGNVATMTSLGGNSDALAGSPLRNSVGDGTARMVPLPFFFTEDSGVALPAAALPFNDIKINYIFRDFNELIVVFPGSYAAGTYGTPQTGDVRVWNDAVTPGSATPALVRAETFAHYAVVHQDERNKMGDAPRDILITQNQTASPTVFTNMDSQTFDLRFSHSIVALFYMAENVSLRLFAQGAFGRECSNYTTQSAFALDFVSATDAQAIQTSGARYPGEGADPYTFTELRYENTARYAMGSDYYMWVAPYYFSDAIPQETGYHCISYSLNMWSQDPMGSTNYSKLANVSLIHDGSAAAIAAYAGNGVDSTGATVALGYINTTGAVVSFPQRFQSITLALNRNIARAANGSLGHPTL